MISNALEDKIAAGVVRNENKIQKMTEFGFIRDKQKNLVHFGLVCLVMDKLVLTLIKQNLHGQIYQYQKDMQIGIQKLQHNQQYQIHKIVFIYIKIYYGGL